MAKVIDLKKYKEEKERKEKEKHRTKSFFQLDYKPSNNCCNSDTYGVVCVKCGRCGRKFSEKGFLK